MVREQSRSEARDTKSEERILIAADDVTLRSQVRRLLARRWTVETVEDGVKALASAQARPPDLVLTDVMMPGLHSSGFLRAIRSDARTRMMPVILMSAREGGEASIEELEAGADGYLVRPFSARELLARVDGALELAKARRDALTREQGLRGALVDVLENMTDAFVRLDRDWRITYINAAAEKVNGVSRNVVLGKCHWDVFPDALGTEFEHQPRRAMAERVPIRCEAFSKPLRIWWEMDVHPVSDGGIALHGRDITDRKQAESALREAESRAEEERQALLASEREARSAAEQASRVKDEFLATLSHELRTPINSVLTWIHLLQSGRLDAVKTEAALRSMERGVKAQVRLIDDLLELSRFTSGKLHLDKCPVDVSAVVQSAIDTVMPAANAKGIRVRFVRSGSRVTLEGDAVRLHQVFCNLLTNALKFTPTGGEVDVRVARTETEQLVSVRDTGQGIAPHLLQQIFQRFRQADGSAARRHGGLGLGLAIVRHLVELHGGSVTAESEGEGRGATFIIRLPIAEARGEASVEGAPVDPSEVDLSGARILLVDDDPDTQAVVVRLLEEYHAETLTVSSADEVLAHLSTFCPQLLISDIGMPGKDGYELMREIRRSKQHTRLPAIALTAFARPEDRERALNTGYDIYLTKPVVPSELLRVVAELIGQRHGDPPNDESQTLPRPPRNSGFLFIPDKTTTTRRTRRSSR